MLQCLDIGFSECMTIHQASMVHANIHFNTKAYCMVHANFHFNTKAYCMVHANIHCAHHSISFGTYKHAFSHHIILYCIHKTCILHTIAYCIAHAKHSYYIPVYKTWLRLEVYHLCVWFLLFVLLVNLMHIAHRMWVPHTNSVANTNRTWHSKLCTCRCAHGVHVGIKMQSVGQAA